MATGNGQLIGSGNATRLAHDSAILPAFGAAFTFVVPAGFAIRGIYIENTTANAVTGGIKVGTTLGGTDVVDAVAVGASAIAHPTDAHLAKRYFSSTVDTTLYVDAVTGWNAAVVNVYLDLARVYAPFSAW